MVNMICTIHSGLTEVKLSGISPSQLWLANKMHMSQAGSFSTDLDPADDPQRNKGERST